MRLISVWRNRAAMILPSPSFTGAVRVITGKSTRSRSISVTMPPSSWPDRMAAAIASTSRSWLPAHLSWAVSSIKARLPNWSSAKRSTIRASYLRAVIKSSCSATGRLFPSIYRLATVSLISSASRRSSPSFSPMYCC